MGLIVDAVLLFRAFWLRRSLRWPHTKVLPRTRVMAARRQPDTESLLNLLTDLRGPKLVLPANIVVDFFAGSGSTGEAVMRLNLEDGGNRRFLMVQLPEETGDTAMPTIAAMVRRRIKAAADQLRTSPSSLDAPDADPDLGFKALRLEASNFSIWESELMDAETLKDQLELAVEHVREGSTESAILYELLLKAGYPLTALVERTDFAAVESYSISDGALLICLSEKLTIEGFEAMAEADPGMILVLDAGFGGSDELKVNALQTVRARNRQRGSDIALRVV